MDNKIKWYQWMVLCLLLFVSINSKFSALLKKPDILLFSAGGDGLKNYMTPMIHVKNDHSYNHFDGMNYPYGEHVLFTDNQPLLSNILRFVQNNITDISQHTVGVLNIMMLLSLFFSGIMLYVFFRRLSLPHWYSLIAAISVAWLSPQIARFCGHYALSYEIIPLLLLYFLMRFEDFTWKWSISICALVLFAPMLHFYYFGISAIFLSVYYFIKVIKDKTTFVFYVKHWVIQVIIPFIFLNFIWLKIGNSVTDRPDSPYGFLHYVTVWEGTFFNPGSWFYTFIDTYLIKIRAVSEFESINYIGFAAFLFVLIRIISWIFTRKVTMLEEDSDLPEGNFLKTAFWASVILYIFSTGLPFKIPQLEFLLAYTGPLKQFRGLGRFSWLFFLVVNIIAFYEIYNWGRRINNVEFRRVFWLVFLIIAAREGLGNANRVGKPADLYETLDTMGEPKENWLSHLDTAKYQAILPLPYFHTGAEYLGLDLNGATFARSLFVSYYSGMPSMGVMMSRTSWQQTLGSFPLGKPLYRVPPVLNNLPNQKPLMALVDKKWLEFAGQDYTILLSKGKKIHENAAFLLYELPIDAYARAIDEKMQGVIQEAHDAKLVRRGNLLTKDSSENFIYKTFDDKETPIRYQGNGAFLLENDKKISLFKGQLPNQQKGAKYKLQFWLNLERGESIRNDFHIREISKKGEELSRLEHGAIHNIVGIDGNWILVQVQVEVKEADSELELTIFNDLPKSSTVYIDELMIYPENAVIYQIGTNSIMKNGRWYK
jgi:hypothetical protein